MVQRHRETSPVHQLAQGVRGAAVGVARLEGTRALPAPTSVCADAATPFERRLREGGGCSPEGNEEGQPGDQAERGKKQV